MALRLLEIMVPAEGAEDVLEALDDQPVHGAWADSLDAERSVVRVLLEAEHAEAICDRIEARFSGREGFRLIMLAVEATLPRIKKEEPPPEEQVTEAAKPKVKKTSRISREELLAAVSETVRPSWVFFVMVILSAVVAAIGLERDNVAVIIGAMVIAPLLGPNVALALATTLGDLDLAKRAVLFNLTGVSIALALALILGLILRVDPAESGELFSRSYVELGDVVLALAAGVACVLAFTTGAPSALIGVMVAVALLPPLMALGLFVGGGQWQAAEGAALLFFTNVICVNLAAVVTFILQGVHPRGWWEAGRAKKATRIAVCIWCVLLLLLVLLIMLARQQAGE